MKHLILPKGYTIYCTSWENDLDNVMENTYTVSTKKEAEIIIKICKELFVSHSRNKKAIGNIAKGAITLIEDYLKNNPDINFTVEEIEKINLELLGEPIESEFYESRVYYSSYVVYSPEDIYVEKLFL